MTPRRLICRPDMQPRVCCTVCGWGVLSPAFVHADAWRGWIRRVTLAYSFRKRSQDARALVCMWCRARGRTV